MTHNIDRTIIYPTLQDAAAAVCQRWCQQEGYSEPIYENGSWWAFPPNGVIPVRIHEIIDVEKTLAQRVLVKHYLIALSIALLPDGCLAPHNHPEN